MVLGEACARDCTLHNLLDYINERLKKMYLGTI